MITAIHSLLYSEDPEATRAFFRDVLGWPYVDAGGGWLIFKSGPSELGVHPNGGDDWSTPPQAEVTLMCDDIHATISQLQEKGATFTGDVQDQNFGWTVNLDVPGGLSLLLYQPKHPAAFGIESQP